MISIHPKIVFRIPCFPINATLKDYWPQLKIAIAESSPEFHVLIQHAETKDLDALSPKVMQTIWKYFNRAKFRATPYGRFAAIGLFNLIEDQSEFLTVATEQLIHKFIDWQNTRTAKFDLNAVNDKNVFLQVNSTHYLIGNVIRFVARSSEGFGLSEIEGDEMIFEILAECQKKLRIADYTNEPARLQLIEHLIKSQLLFTSLMPNIIGEDYFSLTQIPELENEPIKYIISERKHVMGSLDHDLLKHLPAVANLLNELNPVEENLKLEGFILRFTKKFEQNEVPIMVALDPELGVGYDDLEQSTGEDPFLEQLLADVISVDSDKTSNLSSRLISSLLNASQSISSIDIEDLPLKKDKKIPLLPNTFSALCYASDQNLVIESLTGATATALLGRFSLASEEIHTLCKELSEIEKHANPDILFFDLAYQSEGRVDNVNRRRSIYSTQLSILDYDTSQCPLLLNDLLLSVKNGQVIIRSHLFNKRMVPRMTSAYNFNRSDLSVFRLLCDIQHQKVNTSLSFTIQSLIPGLNYYPRLTFKNIVLSCRKWKLDINNGSVENLTILKNVLTLGCRYVKHGIGDQTLCFDLSNNQDLDILNGIVKKQKAIYVEEVLLNNLGNIKDNNGKHYQGQFVISLYHNEPIYERINKSAPKQENAGVVQTLVPGSNWLYYQIFMHPFRVDELLRGEISQLLKSFKEEIAGFFFMRYNEDGEHVRLRFKLNNTTNVLSLMKEFALLLNDKTSSGIITEVRICTYHREGERYGWNRITDVEHFFFQDSQCTMAILEAGLPTELKYNYTMALMDGIKKAGLFHEDDFLKIIQSVSEALNKEHNLGPKQFRQLNDRFKIDIEQGKDNLVEIHFPVATLIESLKNLLGTCMADNERRKLFIDLIHMHVNRLHVTKQRLHEAVTYYFVCKQMLKLKALNNRSQPLTA